MTLVQAIILGAIQGLTEFLPVSSSGHLAVFKNLFNLNLDTGILFDVMLHFATLIAVIIIYSKELGLMIVEFFKMIGDIFKNLGIKLRKSDEPYHQVVCNSIRKFTLMIIVTTIPTGIMGILLEDLVETLQMSLLFPGIFLVLTAIVLFISDRLPEQNGTPRTTSFGKALIIGVAQGCATMPGLSRSGTSVAACVACGMNRAFAVKYAFIMSIPAILGAAVVKIPDLKEAAFTTNEIINYSAGMLVAFIVGFICIKAMLLIVRKKKFTYFGFYCLFIGCLAIGAHAASVM